MGFTEASGCCIGKSGSQSTEAKGFDVSKTHQHNYSEGVWGWTE